MKQIRKKIVQILLRCIDVFQRLTIRYIRIIHIRFHLDEIRYYKIFDKLFLDITTMFCRYTYKSYNRQHRLLNRLNIEVTVDNRELDNRNRKLDNLKQN